jgi:protein-tyrosine phosphatase
LLVTANLVAGTLEMGRKALVTCSAGRNRSGAVAALALQQVQRMSPEESIAAVQLACGEIALRDHNLVKVIMAYRPGV